MNEYEIDDACARYKDHPLLGPATLTLAALRDATNAFSDGWAYWPKPSRAARKLQELIHGPSPQSYYDDEREDVTEANLRAAYAPIKAFRTRSGLAFEITTELPPVKSTVDIISDPNQDRIYPPFTTRDATAMAVIQDLAHRGARLARMMPDGDTVIYGTARSLGDATASRFARSDEDVRELYLRVTTVQGFECFWPVLDLITAHHDGYLFPDASER
jgi:hypothetical protein